MRFILRTSFHNMPCLWLAKWIKLFSQLAKMEDLGEITHAHEYIMLLSLKLMVSYALIPIIFSSQAKCLCIFVPHSCFWTSLTLEPKVVQKRQTMDFIPSRIFCDRLSPDKPSLQCMNRIKRSVISASGATYLIMRAICSFLRPHLPKWKRINFVQLLLYVLFNLMTIDHN